MAYLSHGASCYSKRLLKEAEKYLLKGLEFCEKINLPTWMPVDNQRWGRPILRWEIS